MIPSIETLLAALATSCVAFALIFLPAMIELKKPKDAGPRQIDDSAVLTRLQEPKN